MVRDALHLSWVLLFPHRMKDCRSSREAENSGLLGLWVDRTKEVASRSLCDQNLSGRFLGWLLLAPPPTRSASIERTFPILPKGC